MFVVDVVGEVWDCEFVCSSMVMTEVGLSFFGSYSAVMFTGAVCDTMSCVSDASNMVDSSVVEDICISCYSTVTYGTFSCGCWTAVHYDYNVVWMCFGSTVVSG